ncbi:polysaccharide deacetylase family protein [Clostridium peptidivorans]|uniref:polysaccharide deacetylase family protein n=1 Tax=Clostridium peptidivorans TaxID=100174 RepID=UPI000BE3E878|nr:polysaccharide deacetylase family protein [Clostridium peptidivorans]
MKKSACIISIVSLLIISFTIVGAMKIRTMHEDTNKANLLVVKDNSIKAAQPNSKSPDSTNNKSLPLLEKERMAKGGVIGTAGKGVVVLRFDDYQNVFREKIYPMLVERGLPCSMALISRFNTAQSWGKGTTWDDIRHWNRNGVEIWSHGTDHRDYSKNGYSGLYSQIVISKEEIEAQDIKVVGWVLPGVKPTTKNLPYNGLTKPSHYNSTTGKLLMDTYALTEAYAYKPQRILPTNIYHGLGHITVSDGGETVSSVIEEINAVIKNKSGIELMCHAGNLGKAGNLTFEEFETLLNYIKMQWDKDSIEVLTPSGICFADPNSSSRLKLNVDDSFEGLTTANPGAWKETKNWAGKTIETSAGRTGNNFLRINSDAADSGVTQRIADLDKLGVAGEQFVFEGWFRSYGSKDTIGVVQIDDYDNPSKLKIVKKTVSNDTAWTRVRFVFCIPPGTKNITLSLYRDTEAGIDWDDISIKKI